MTEKLQNLFAQAQKCFDKKDWDGAIRYCSEIIDLPEDQISKENCVKALDNRGVAYSEKGEFDRAIRDYDQAIRINPNFAEAFDHRGIAFAKKDELDRAIRDFDQALKIKPDFAKALNNRGLTFTKKDELDRAISDYDQALKIQPNNAGILNNRGAAFAEKGELDRAIRDFDKALKLKPDFAKALNNRGIAFAKKGELDRAIRDHDHALEIDPDLAKAFNSRGIAFAKKGELDRAISDFDHALKSKPDYADAFYNRGIAFEKKDDFERALRDYGQAIKFKPDYADAHNDRAILLARGYAQKTEKKIKKEYEEQLRQTTDPLKIIESYEGREKDYRDQISELDSKIENRTSWLFGVLIVGFLTIAVVVFEVWRRLAFGSSDCEMPNCSAHGVVIVNCCPTDRGEVSFAGLFAIAPLTLVLFTACFPLIAHLFNLRKEKRRLQVCVEDYFRKQTLVRYTLLAKDEHKQRLIAITHAHFATRSTAEFLAGWKPESEENPNPLTDAIDKAIRGIKDAASSKPTEKSPS